MTTTTTVTVASLLTGVGSVVTAAVGWVGDFAGAIADNPILLLGVVSVPLCGIGVGLIKRLLSARA